MKRNETRVQAWIGLSEGGYVNNPRDPGGPTDRGITQKTFDAWNHRLGLPSRPVKGISKATAEAIIAAQYLAPIRFDDLPSGLDYALADYSVNSGPAQAARTLQRILGVEPDGVIGAITLDAIKGRNVEALIVALCEARMRFLRGLKTWRTFGRGWAARVMGAEEGFQEADVGVIDRAVMLARDTASIPAPTVAAPAKAEPPPEPQTVAEDGEARGALIGAGGAVAASGGVISAIGDLSPEVQALAIGGLLVAAVALLWIFRKRLARIAA